MASFLRHLPLLLALGATALWQSRSGALPLNGACSIAANSNRFSVAPNVSQADSYVYCFTLKVNPCSNAKSPCCKNSTTVAFSVDIGEICLYETITATLNEKAVPGAKIGEPSSNGFGTSAVLTVPGLKLDTKTLGTKGAQLCIKLPKVSECGSVDRMMPSNAKQWNATLISTDQQCCPLTTLQPPPAVKCETCWVWDVVPPKTAKPGWPAYNFLSRNSCPLASLKPTDPDAAFKTCCEFEAYYYTMYFADLRAKGLVTGFDKAVCNATSLRLCGSFTSRAAGLGLVAELAAYGDSLRSDFDNTDDTCPMGLFGATVRLRSVLPSNGSMDTRCAPLNQNVDRICSEPTVKDSLSTSNKTFPNTLCKTTPGSTPFMMDKFYEVSYFDTNNAYCVSIGITTPSPAKTTCANATTLDRVSFWIISDSATRRSKYLGAYMLTKEGTAGYKRTNLTASWGAEGEQVYNVGSLGLDVASVKAKQPKICILRNNDGHVWYDTVSSMGYLWTALYDKSGSCCPVYYANRF